MSLLDPNGFQLINVSNNRQPEEPKMVKASIRVPNVGSPNFEADIDLINYAELHKIRNIKSVIIHFYPFADIINQNFTQPSANYSWTLTARNGVRLAGYCEPGFGFGVDMYRIFPMSNPLALKFTAQELKSETPLTGLFIDFLFCNFVVNPHDYTYQVRIS